MRALVLGGNGFIGSHVVDALLNDGYFVRVLDRSPEMFRKSLDRVDYFRGLFDDIPLLIEALQGIDIVYHFISTTVPGTSNQDPVSDIQSNLISTVRLFEQMNKTGVERIVFLSSGGTVYGIPKQWPINEDHPTQPICSYGIVKVANESYLQIFQELHNIRPVILRASNPYGERQGHIGVQGVIGTFLAKVAKGESIQIWGDGNIIRDFIYVGDLVRLCVVAAESEYCGVFNAGSGKGHSINHILKEIIAITGVTPQVDYKPGRAFDIPRVVLDISKAVKTFGWNPDTELQNGIKKTWSWMQNIKI